MEVAGKCCRTILTIGTGKKRWGSVSSLDECLDTHPPNTSMHVVESIRTGYLKGLEAYAGVTARLEDLKMSLGPENIAKLEERYNSSGGEQFLEDREGLNCKFRA